MHSLNHIKIKVNHFGPLESVTFELAPMMVFTGLSSTGKSYANYLVYYFMYEICNGNISYYLDDKLNSELLYQKRVFDLDNYLSMLSSKVQNYMQSFLGDDTLTCDVEFESDLQNRSFVFEIEKKVESEEVETAGAVRKESFVLKINGEEHRSILDFYSIPFYIDAFIGDVILGELFFREVILPPGRGAFVGESYTLKKEVSSSMDMYNSFFKDYDYGVRGKDTENGQLSELLLNMTSGGKLLSVESKQYLQLDEEHRISLSASASSVKELSPWLFFLQNQSIGYHSYCLEEPEAHQHPSVTVKIVDVMAIMLNQGSMFHLTTHSDYLIQRINQLIKLGRIRKVKPSLFESICKERNLDTKCFINASEIKAYYFSKGPEGKTIVEELAITEEGIPMKSFFDVVRDLNEREDYINEAIYAMGKED